jgi:hypothetical protein
LQQYDFFKFFKEVKMKLNTGRVPQICVLKYSAYEIMRIQNRTNQRKEASWTSALGVEWSPAVSDREV